MFLTFSQLTRMAFCLALKFAKAFLYLCNGVEAAFLYFLYDWNFKEMKKSSIIGALRNVFGSLALVFGVICFIILLKQDDYAVDYLVMSVLSIVVLIFSFISLRAFRRASIFGDDKQLKQISKYVKKGISKVKKKRKER